ncbi:MAG TPA: AlkA N-terminal domain-containing protein [Anaeromyxobacteraceae bacterium]|nr:AlkA N-terminal domain-containing protein [Anaeromyxobacteraceae bacterium]
MPKPHPNPALDRDACYRALRTRDARFDGRFYTAVLSTGIFCRPVCPARTPRPEHCVFFPSAAAAHAAGFRPCLRCRPELAPGVAGWRGTANTVSRALALIAEGAWGEEQDAEGLAERLGVGGRHLRRLFARHVGAPPVAVAQAQRVLFAKRLLGETALPMAEVAAAAGFGSVRRFNHVMRRTFQRPPRALRRGGRSDPPDGPVSLRLPHTAPYRWESLLAFLGARAIPGVEEVSGGEYRRTLAVDGAAGSVAVRPVPGASELLATIRLSRVAALPAVVGRLRRLLDLDADAQAIDSHLAGDSLLAPLVAARPGLRVPGAWDPFELAVRAILGQQVSVAAARTLAGRIAAACGERVPGGGLAFPGPERLAGARLERIGLTRARAAAIRSLARAAAGDPSLLEGRGDLDQAVARLMELPGIGRWTAHYVAMRALREPDAFPEADLGLLRSAARRGLRVSPAGLARRAEAWRPWRAYAAMHLWTAEAGAPAPRAKGD